MRVLVLTFLLSLLRSHALVDGNQTTIKGVLTADPHEIVVSPKGVRRPYDVMNTVGKNEKEAIYCYERLLKGNPKATGKVIVRLDLERSGDVSKALISNSELKDQEFTSCFLNALSGINFGAAQGQTRITLPISLFWRTEPPLGHKMPTNPIYELPPAQPGVIEN